MLRDSSLSVRQSSLRENIDSEMEPKSQSLYELIRTGREVNFEFRTCSSNGAPIPRWSGACCEKKFHKNLESVFNGEPLV